MHTGHFLAISEQTHTSLNGLLDLAHELKTARKRHEWSTLANGRTLALLFQKPSLRTRVSFEMAMRQLGGDCLYLSPAEVQMGTRESTPDVARVLGRYVDCIAARVFNHTDVVGLAEHAGVPVINALSDLCHPCQALADLLTIKEVAGTFKGVRLAFIGDGNNNVGRSLMLAAALCGVDYRVASPAGYEPDAAVLAQARDFAKQSGAAIVVTGDPREAVTDAHFVYTDVWASMGQEAEAERRRVLFSEFHVNEQLMALADREARFMHDLPAHRGEEVADHVIDGVQSIVFEQAENRMHAQRAVLYKLLALS